MYSICTPCFRLLSTAIRHSNDLKKRMKVLNENHCNDKICCVEMKDENLNGDDNFNDEGDFNDNDKHSDAIPTEMHLADHNYVISQVSEIKQEPASPGDVPMSQQGPASPGDVPMSHDNTPTAKLQVDGQLRDKLVSSCNLFGVCMKPITFNFKL